MGEPFIGGGNTPQMLITVNQHQARSVDAEHRVRGVHDLVDGVLDVHLAEAQLAELQQCLMDIM